MLVMGKALESILPCLVLKDEPVEPLSKVLIDLASERSFPASDSPAWIFRDASQRELAANVVERRDP
jgi:hypothetical protein